MLHRLGNLRSSSTLPIIDQHKWLVSIKIAFYTGHLPLLMIPADFLSFFSYKSINEQPRYKQFDRSNLQQKMRISRKLVSRLETTAPPNLSTDKHPPQNARGTNFQSSLQRFPCARARKPRARLCLCGRVRVHACSRRGTMCKEGRSARDNIYRHGRAARHVESDAPASDYVTARAFCPGFKCTLARECARARPLHRGVLRRLYRARGPARGMSASVNCAISTLYTRSPASRPLNTLWQVGDGGLYYARALSLFSSIVAF